MKVDRRWLIVAVLLAGGGYVFVLDWLERGGRQADGRRALIADGFQQLEKAVSARDRAWSDWVRGGFPDGAAPIAEVVAVRPEARTVTVRVPTPGPVQRVSVETFVPGPCVEGCEEAVAASIKELASQLPTGPWLLYADLGADQLGQRCHAQLADPGDGTTMARVYGEAWFAIDGPDGADLTLSTGRRLFEELEMGAAAPIRPRWPRMVEVRVGFTTAPGWTVGGSYYGRGKRLGWWGAYERSADPDVAAFDGYSHPVNRSAIAGGAMYRFGPR